eukprot:jgi/Hompol1/6558/HPOL_000748-RA
MRLTEAIGKSFTIRARQAALASYRKAGHETLQDVDVRLGWGVAYLLVRFYGLRVFLHTSQIRDATPAPFNAVAHIQAKYGSILHFNNSQVYTPAHRFHNISSQRVCIDSALMMFEVVRCFEKDNPSFLEVGFGANLYLFGVAKVVAEAVDEGIVGAAYGIGLIRMAVKLLTALALHEPLALRQAEALQKRIPPLVDKYFLK